MGDPAPSPSSRLQVLFESALQDYEKQTGTKLTEHPLARQLETCDSVESVTAVIQGQGRDFGEFKGSEGKVSKSLQRAVSVLYPLSISAVLGNATSLRFSPGQALFAGLGILLAAFKGVNTSYDTLVDLLESIEHFLVRLDIYTKIPPTAVVTEIIVKIMVELLSTFALVTKQIKEKRPTKFVKKLLGDNEIEAVLQRLDRLTQDEARTTSAQTLEIVYGLIQNMRVVMDDGKASAEGVREALLIMQQVANDMNRSKRDKVQQDFRNWLAPPDPFRNHNLAQESYHSGTAAWFIHGNPFAEWKFSGPSSLLWIHGKPGAGKTVLCSTIIEDLIVMRNSGLASLAFYYCDFRDDHKKTLRGLLSSLLFQLCDQSGCYLTILSDFHSAHCRGAQDPSDRALAQCLNNMLTFPAQAPIYIIIDALDECPSTSAMPSPREKVLMFVEDLVNSRIPNLRICVTSRPETDVSFFLEPLTFRAISLHSETGQMQDINNYIRSVINADRIMRKWKAVDKELVIEVLTKKADGMFRWVYCQIVYIRRCLPGRIRYALDELPETLDETYERTLRDIDKATWECAHHLFQCVAAASRPLRVEEITDILALDFKTGPIPKFLEDWRPEDPVDAILSTCSTLLAVVKVEDSSVIQFSHFSVKEFLTSGRLSTANEAISRYHVSLTPTHTFLAQACLGVLLHLGENITINTLRNFPLSEYAAEHWVDHARYENVSLQIQDGLVRLFDPNKPHFAIWVWIYDPEAPWRRTERAEEPSRPRGTPLHYAALCGFPDIAKFLILKRSQDVNARGFDDQATPLFSASRNGHLMVSRVLLEHGAKATAQDDANWTALHEAAYRGHANIARLLLEHGADVMCQDKRKSTPLHRASYRGHPEAVRVLLEYGADPKAQDMRRSTPFHEASEGGHPDVTEVLREFVGEKGAQDKRKSTPLHDASYRGDVEVVLDLLEHGADATAQNDLGRSPLHYASEGGYLRAVRLLLDHGADATAPDDLGRTPLHRASYRGDVEIARILLEHGAVATAPDNLDWTPLHEVSYRGHFEIARLFLEHGADANVKDSEFVTPLHQAAHWGHLDIVRILLEHGADPTAQNHKGRTAFQIASAQKHPDIMQLLGMELSNVVGAVLALD